MFADQLMYLPPGYQPQDPSTPLKKVLMWNGLSSWGGVKAGRGEFLKQECPVSTCVLVSDKRQGEEADLIIFKDIFSKPSFTRPGSQLWMIYMLECPLHTQVLPQRGVFNWTATYRADSTIVTPYERWEEYLIIYRLGYLVPTIGGSIMTGVCRLGYRILTMQLIRQDRWLGLYLTVGQGRHLYIKRSRSLSPFYIITCVDIVRW